MSSISDEPAAKRRRVRKGTHSCWECRRRKVKCTLESSDDAICITCRRRGTECIGQEVLNGPEMTEDNADDAEKNVENRPIGEDVGNTLPDPQHAAAYSASSLPLPMSSTPASSLQGSSVAHFVSLGHVVQNEQPPSLPTTPQLPPTPASNHAFKAESFIHPEIVDSLFRALPLKVDIEILLGKITRVPRFCLQSDVRSASSRPSELPGERTAIPNLLHPETHPVLLARQMLQFAASLQHLAPKEVIPGLTKHHHVIMEELAETAIKLVNSNDALLSTLECLENIVLEGLYHIYSGNIRRAWITMRRAVMAAQLLGLGRPGHYRFKLLSDHNDLDPEDMWVCIVSMERVLSLLLGLPTSTNGTSFAFQNTTRTCMESGNIPAFIVDVSAKILERNQLNVSRQALDLTQVIDRELVTATEQLPATFWRPLVFANLQRESMNAYLETRRAWDQMFYYTLVNQLHLPYMLCPSHTPQTVYSKIACVNASREVLTRQIMIHEFNMITACCRMGDFLALIAGMTLMLAHIVSHCQEEMNNLLVHQRMSDRAKVEQALQCMQSMSELHEDVLPARCAALLKDLLAVDADAARERSYGAPKPQGTRCQQEKDCSVLLIKVPYLGAIRIAREGVTFIAPVDTEQVPGLQDGLTIGGIGSIHFNNPGLADNVTSDGTSNITALPTASTRALNAPSIQQSVAHVAQSVSEDPLTQQDQLLPDAAANIDDWVFQGLDTAFFDVLMRGAGDPQPNSAGTAEWDFNL